MTESNDSVPMESERNWVLHTPYQVPDQHWRLDEQGRTTDKQNAGRRPSSTQLPVPKAKGEVVWGEPNEDVEPHKTINEIREHVSSWSAREWPGATPRLRDLLLSWATGEAGYSPFWCQRAAVETLVWLFDDGVETDRKARAEIKWRLDAANKRWNMSIPRVATKMATGTGKTHVMAMIALWQAIRHEGMPLNFLIITPGLTIKERLQALEDMESEVWESVIPRSGDYRRYVSRINWEIINFQAFQQRTTLEVGGKAATGKEKRVLLGPGDITEPGSWTEAVSDMLNRLLRSHHPSLPTVVINDEAHHCYTLKNTDVARGERVAREERDEEIADRKRADLWFGALQALVRHRQLGQVFDLSATPMWLRRPVRLQAETFPWTVSDYSLLDAVEAGLVKVPRVPVKDLGKNEDDEPLHMQPRYRNIYQFNEGRKIGATLEPEVRDPLLELYEHYEELDQMYEDLYQEKLANGETSAQRHIPVMIVVANTIENATSLYHYIAGGKSDGSWSEGKLQLFSNVDGGTGKPKGVPPTILVHSQLIDPVDDTQSSRKKIASAVEEISEIFAPEAESYKERQEAIRDVFMNVGKKGMGKDIRCVISVGMLTEGWDARSVSHVFGYRAFGSQLLCEQVAGRALRKTSFTNIDEKQEVEYANLFGVPFAWLDGKKSDTPTTPVEAWEVYTVPGREDLRIRFPQVAAFVHSDFPHWSIDPSGVQGLKVAPRQEWGAEVEGTIGKTLVVASKPQSKKLAAWNAAAQLMPLLEGFGDRSNTGWRHCRTAFLDSLKIIEQCLPIINIKDPTDLQYDRGALEEIARNTELVDSVPMPVPVFADQLDKGRPRVLDTSDVYFRTTLRHRHEAEFSELNAAACHSHSEVQLAAILDEHPDIQSWVRNFKLGWRTPWFDAQSGSWRMMEPDFIAKSKHKTPMGRTRMLVIEFKGMLAGEESEEAKHRYLEERWVPAVSNHGADGDEDYGDWRCVWIENIATAQQQISEASAD